MKIFIKELEFMGDCKSLIGPYYCQYFLYALRQNVSSSSHLFSFYEKECSHIIASDFNFDKLVYEENKIYYIINFNSSYIQGFDKKNVNIINFTNYSSFYENAKVISKYAPYDFHIYSENTYELSKAPKYDQFNFCIFCDKISDISQMINFWKTKKYLSGNLYCFYLDLDIKGLDVITKLNFDCENKNIQFFDLKSCNLELVLNVLKNSAFSLHYSHNLIYSFWSMRLKCYPVVLKDDVFSKYVKHVKSRDDFTSIVDSFWFYRKELAFLIKSIDKIVVNKFYLSNII